MDKSILVITNGDSAASAIQSTDLENEHVLPWRDVLYEGPVPENVGDAVLRKIRAEYLAECGYGKHDEIANQFDERDKLIESSDRFDEIVLWFEHDLYDQLQLIQILARLRELAAERVSILCNDRFVAHQSSAELERQFHHRLAITRETFAEAGHAWSCFTSTDPTRLAEIAIGPASRALPYLTSAFSRLIAEFPDQYTGLSMTEEFILRRLDLSNLSSGKDLFREHTLAEQAEFMGDWSFFRVLLDLAAPPNPLVQLDDGFEPLPEGRHIGDCADLAFRILPIGRRVVRGETNAIGLRGIDRWIGGVHLVTDAVWVRRPVRKRDNRQGYTVIGPVDLDKNPGRSSNFR